MSDKRFTLILSIVGGITALCGVLLVLIAFWGPNPQPPHIAALFETLKYVFTIGVLTIFGLLPSKLASPPEKPSTPNEPAS